MEPVFTNLLLWVLDQDFCPDIQKHYYILYLYDCPLFYDGQLLLRCYIYMQPIFRRHWQEQKYCIPSTVPLCLRLSRYFNSSQFLPISTLHFRHSAYYRNHCVDKRIYQLFFEVTCPTQIKLTKRSWLYFFLVLYRISLNVFTRKTLFIEHQPQLFNVDHVINIFLLISKSHPLLIE